MLTYDYQVERHRLFTDEGQRLFLRVRDQVRRLLNASGAVQMGNAISGFSGDSWLLLACVDRMVELEEIKEVHPSAEVAGQHRVFVNDKLL